MLGGSRPKVFNRNTSALRRMGILAGGSACCQGCVISELRPAVSTVDLHPAVAFRLPLAIRRQILGRPPQRRRSDPARTTESRNTPGLYPRGLTDWAHISQPPRRASPCPWE